MFKLGKNISHIPRIKINNISIKYTKELKYLVLIFDNKLSWIPHLNNLKTKIDHLTYRIKSVARSRWGLKPTIVKDIYKLVIEKMILYGVTIWYKPHAKILAKVPQLQRQALLIITKCYGTVLYDSLSVLSGCMPINLVLEKEIEFQDELEKNGKK